jgi:hypothetical protein
MSNSKIIINSIHFIKKVVFPGDDGSVCELISLNKEISGLKDNIPFTNVKVIASTFRELPHHNNNVNTLDIRKNISEKEVEVLSEILSNESAFIKQINTLI